MQSQGKGTFNGQLNTYFYFLLLELYTEDQDFQEAHRAHSFGVNLGVNGVSVFLPVGYKKVSVRMFDQHIIYRPKSLYYLLL